MLKRSILLATLAATASTALATKTQFFRHGSKAEFETGKLDGVVATNFGELKLTRAIETLLPDEGKFASVDALAEAPDGTIYVGTTANGKLISLKDGKPTELADFGEGASVAALKFNVGGDLLIGVGGDAAELLILKAGSAKPERVIRFETEGGPTYIWGIAVATDGKVYLATGPTGQLVEVDLTAKTSRVVYDSDEDNLRSIVLLNDTLFVGTDPQGLILKIDRTSGKAFVVYDAPETEISTLLIDSQSGQIYAGTSQLVEAAAPTPAVTPDAVSGSSVGRPGETHATGKPIDIEPTEPPKDKPDDQDPPGTLRADDAALPAKPEPTPTTQPNIDGSSDAGPQPTTGSNAGTPLPTPGSTGDAALNGNAVYRIDPQGFVTEIFRAEVMVFGLARQNETLYIATGPSGTLYQLDPKTEEHAAIAQTRAGNLTSVMAASDGRILVGSAGSAELSVLGSGIAKVGTFTSPVLDANQISAFGKLQIRGAVPEGTSITVSTRSSNVSDDESALWSEWSPEQPAARFVTMATPAAQYVQYRVTLNGDGKGTPTLDEVSLAYQQPNVAPRIDAISLTATAATPPEGAAATEPAANPIRQVQWTSTEPNGDDIRFTLSIRSGPTQPWVPLAKDLTEATYNWDTRRNADGRYEVRVEASDALANAPGTGKTASRVSDPVVIDNTPPVIGDVKVGQNNGKAMIELRVADRGGTIAGVEYAVDGDEHWQTVLPSDMLHDSPDEQYVIVLPDAGGPGSATRVVSIRARDENGNAAHESVTVRPEK